MESDRTPGSFRRLLRNLRKGAERAAALCPDLSNVRIETITYRQFCARVRKHGPATNEELYREWCTFLAADSTDYAKSYKRLVKRRKGTPDAD